MTAYHDNGDSWDLDIENNPACGLGKSNSPIDLPSDMEVYETEDFFSKHYENLKGDTPEYDESNNWFVWRILPEPNTYEPPSSGFTTGWNIISSAVYGKIEATTEDGEIVERIEAVYLFNPDTKKLELSKNLNNQWIVKRNQGAWIKLSEPATLKITELNEPF